MLDKKELKSTKVFIIVISIILVLTLFSGCLEKNPIDKLIEEKHEEIDPIKVKRVIMKNNQKNLIKLSKNKVENQKNKWMHLT